MKLNKDLREFIELLNSHRVEYVLVGGHAVAYHGYPRYTGDIDFLVRPSEENASRLLAVLKDFGMGALGLTSTDFTSPGQIIQFGYPPNRIDLITKISAVTFDEAWSSRIEINMDGLPVSILSKASLLKNKRASGRAKDLADVEELDD